MCEETPLIHDCEIRKDPCQLPFQSVCSVTLHLVPFGGGAYMRDVMFWYSCTSEENEGRIRQFSALAASEQHGEETAHKVLTQASSIRDMRL